MISSLFRKVFSKFSSSSTEGSANKSNSIEEYEDPRFSALRTCQANYVPSFGQARAKDQCHCQTDANKLLSGLDRMMPKHFIDVLRKYCDMNVHELMEELINVNSGSIGNSGCKNRMLLQLKEIFLMNHAFKNDTVYPTERRIHTLPTCRPNSLFCRCPPANPDDLIYGMELLLPRNLIDELRGYCEMDLIQLRCKVDCYGEYFAGGCKNQMLLFLRDKLLELNGHRGVMSRDQVAETWEEDDIDCKSEAGTELSLEHNVASGAASLMESETIDPFELQSLPTCENSYADLQADVHECSCVTDPAVFLAGLAYLLPPVSIDMLRDSYQMSIFQIIEQISIFGEGGAPITGCKNKMLLQLREIFLSQNNILELHSPTNLRNKYHVAGSSLSREENAESTPWPPLEEDFVTSFVESLAEMSQDQKQLIKSMLSDADRSKNDETHQLDCCICLDQKRSVVFVPCGHVTCCRECADQLTTCAVCRSAIDMKLNVHYA